MHNPETMKTLLHQLLIGTAALTLLAAGLVACASSGDDRYSSASKSEVTQNEKKFRFNGVVVYHRSSGDYTLVSDSGEEYYPINLDPYYRKNGLRVQVYGEGRGWAKGGRMRALAIYDIKAATVVPQ